MTKIKVIKKKWVVIWKRDKKLLALYRMKKTDIVFTEMQETTGDKMIFEGCAIFNRKIDAEKYRQNNRDWEIVKVEIKI